MAHFSSLGPHKEKLPKNNQIWQEILKERELTTIKTGLGNIYRRQTHVKYMQARIGGWAWMLPIILTTVACGFGIAANLYTKLEMTREPRGKYGVMLDKIFQDVSLFENDMYDVKNDTDKECVPFAGLDDVLNTEGNHLSKDFDICDLEI